MKFSFDHNNINVFNLEKSIAFYEKALHFTPIKTKESADGSFKLVFLSDGTSTHRLELTWLRDRKTPYHLGDNEFHLALLVDDYNAAYQHHKEMGCIVYENNTMGIYFIADPDGYWTEIIPSR